MTAGEFEKLKELIRPIAEQYGVERVSLFGSRARGEERPDSDYDFLISSGNITDFFQLGGLLNDFEDALGRDVDIVTDTCDDPEFVQDIKEDEVLVYEQAR
ncbi:MAG: nucleotidyltransferase domain-containing protein [Fretibacterium sp.]|nr:nucleotidyltransferase domain-containing protein [Fretibacterium sp.]